MKSLQKALKCGNVKDTTIFDNVKTKIDSTIELGKNVQTLVECLHKVATANDDLEKLLTTQTDFDPEAVVLANEVANSVITILKAKKNIEAQYEAANAFIQDRKRRRDQLGAMNPEPCSPAKISQDLRRCSGGF
jgi:hypothetical protein